MEQLSGVSEEIICGSVWDNRSLSRSVFMFSVFVVKKEANSSQKGCVSGLTLGGV